MCTKSATYGVADTFPKHGLLPKQATNVESFRQRFPDYDGRNVRVAVLDTGVDPAALGLDGPNKVVDIIDCSGAGDVPLQRVEAQARTDDSAILELESPTTKRKLLVDAAWPNPSGVWKVGTKRAYDLWPTGLVERRTKERKKAFDVSHAALLQRALDELASERASTPSSTSDAKDRDAAAQRCEELQARVSVLKDMHKAWKDPGPVLEAVVFHDGVHWRAVVGGAEGDVIDSSKGEPESQHAMVLDLREKPRLTDYRLEREWAYFGEMDLLTYSVNIMNDGQLLSIVTLSGTHGTHVAGIIGAQTQDPATDGVAPGTEIVSLRIGDARLGSMEQGQALLRAAQALIDTRCDVANMSYGEDGAFGVEDKGAFAHALHQVIREHGVCFVSSAGNNGPALTTVGQPGGTTSGVLSVGAYVTAGDMQQAEYALVERGVPSNVTTWCSRGPTADGAAGVSIYAPGAAFTSICRYALQSTQLMNGTSMSSPNAAGAVALLVGACKAEGITPTPFRIFRAIQESGADVRDPQGIKFLDVEKAWDYILAHRDDPYADADMRVRVTRAGKPSNVVDQRGVYLREVEETHRTTQFLVTVQPTFRSGETQRAYKLDLKTSLSATQPWVHVPEFLALGGNGRTFEIRIAADALPPGLHTAQVIAHDTERNGAVVFDVPITVAKPVVPPTATYAYPPVRLASGDIHREFVQVPMGATWADVRVRSVKHEAPGTSVRFWLHMLQLVPQRRLSKVEQHFVLALNENEPISKRVPVYGGMTLEVCAAQFWSSKAGFELELDVEFHGLDTVPKLVAHSGDAHTKVDVTSLVRCEDLKPSASLDTRRTYVRPSKYVLRPLREPRDRQPSGHQLHELVLEYPVTVKDACALTWRLPLSGHLYDASVTLLTQLLDVNQAQVAFGDVYAKPVDVAKGEYTLRVQALHESAAVLDQLNAMPLSLEQKLKKDISLDVYRDHVDLQSHVRPAKEALKLHKGERAVLCIDTALHGERWPSDGVSVHTGDVLCGTLTLGGSSDAKAAKVPLDVVVGPPPPSKSAANAAPNDPPREPASLPTLLAGLVCKVPESDKSAFVEQLVQKYPTDLSVRVAALDACDAEDADASLRAAQGVRECIDETALRLWLGTKQPPTAEQTHEQKATAKTMQTHKAALVNALVREAKAHAQRDPSSQACTDAIMHARQYVDDSDARLRAMHTNLLTAWHQRNERYGYALQGVRKQLDDLGRGTSDTRDDLRRAHDLQCELLEHLRWDVWRHYETRWAWLRRPSTGAAPF